MTGLRGFVSRPVVAILAVTALGAALRFVHLSHPDEFVFDELYYAKAGCILIGETDRTCRLDDTEKLFREQRWDVGSYVHPDLGKWQIALGEKAFGMTSFGWRATSALAGTLVVLIGAVLAWTLFRNVVWTAVGGLFIAVDGMNLALSRTALLDVHLQLWVAAGFLFLVLDRSWIERRSAVAPATPTGAGAALGSDGDDGGEAGDDADGEVPPRPEPPVYSPVWRPWRWAAGAAFGAAVAVKWSGAFALAAAVILAYLWETSRRRRRDPSVGRAVGRAVARESFGIVLALAFVPVLVYTASWLPWFHHFGHDVVGEPVASLRALVSEHDQMWEYHRRTLQEFEEDDEGNVTPTHAYYSRPWKWPILARPVLFYSDRGKGDVAQISAIGNPAIAWASVVAVPYLALAWWRLGDWRAGMLLVAFAGQWLPWFAMSRPQFSFYLLPMTPFLALAVTYLLWKLSEARIVVRDRETGVVATNPETGGPAVSRGRPYLPFVIAFVVAVIGLAVWFWPIVSAGRISDDRWRAIVWFRAWM
ncbi:MAG TPA: phospholipid carrier-dependent glycosyltransferase [Actinomycetota bacterium]|nr:phospholipid carrier-dependent glycosyltransferase [Actinomycetota bacterium]